MTNKNVKFSVNWVNGLEMLTENKKKIVDLIKNVFLVLNQVGSNRLLSEEQRNERYVALSKNLIYLEMILND